MMVEFRNDFAVFNYFLVQLCIIFNKDTVSKMRI